MTVVILAALAMFLQDIIAVPLTQAEARNRAHLAGALDTLGWLVAIATTTISVSALQGHSLALKVGVVLAVSAANYLGTVLGTKLGRRFVKAEAPDVRCNPSCPHCTCTKQDSSRTSHLPGARTAAV